MRTSIALAAAIVFAGASAFAAEPAPAPAAPAPACQSPSVAAGQIADPYLLIEELSREATAAWGTPCAGPLVDAAGAALSVHVIKGPFFVKKGTQSANRPDAAIFAEAAIKQRARQGGAPSGIGGAPSGIPGFPGAKPAAPAVPGIGGLFGK